MDQDKVVKSIKYLELLAKQYPTIQSASTEIVNLQAILDLPKGTEHFMSDIHGEWEAFTHILNNASGEIRQKVDLLYTNILTTSERAQLATLIYYPEEKLEELSHDANIDEWYKITLHRLLDICKLVASKYTRSKVRKALPPEFVYILDELLSTNIDTKRTESYYDSIIASITEIGNAEECIMALCSVIKRLVVDHLHIVGDLFDRGKRPDIIIDMLMNHHGVDIQWGNHDVLWMGAAAGNPVCIATVIANGIKYGNLDSLELAYGLNLRPLTMFAREMYPPHELFKPKYDSQMPYKSKDLDMLSSMFQAILMIQFKLEEQTISRHPEYEMDSRRIMSKVDFENMTVTLYGKKHNLKKYNFPTIDRENPTKLSAEEIEVVEQLIASFEGSDKLQTHIRFLYSEGSLYKCVNNNLLLHGCVPIDDKGEIASNKSLGKSLSGKLYFDTADVLARQGYYAPANSKLKGDGMDYLWYLWCGPYSPVFGRKKLATFERMFIEDKATHHEQDDAYYKMIEDPKVVERIFKEFSLDKQTGHIINGHIPVNAKSGESPVKAGGKVIVIDGGFCRVYQQKTGIAGYTLIYDSHGIRISSHEPFPGFEEAIAKNIDIFSQEAVFETALNRLKVRDTDTGNMIMTQINELKLLLDAYRMGHIAEGKFRK